MDARSKEILTLKRENAELRARVEYLESEMALGRAGVGPRDGAVPSHGGETNSNSGSSSSISSSGSHTSKATSSRTAVSTTSPHPKSPPPVPPRPVP